MDVRFWYLTSVTLHILAAAVWIGSMIFLAAVLVPVLRRSEYSDIRTPLFHHTGIGLRYVAWISMLVLVITGITNLGLRGYRWAHAFDGILWQGSWGSVLAWKLGLVGVVIAVSFVHDFILGPKTMKMLAEERDAEVIKGIRRRASMMGRIVLILSIVILVLAVRLVR